MILNVILIVLLCLLFVIASWGAYYDWIGRIFETHGKLLKVIRGEYKKNESEFGQILVELDLGLQKPDGRVFVLNAGEYIQDIHIDGVLVCFNKKYRTFEWIHNTPQELKYEVKQIIQSIRSTNKKLKKAMRTVQTDEEIRLSLEREQLSLLYNK